ncbi:MAG TPA: DUF1559 domain-containing protein, partial [Urbifossiella sp.]|nr:DUF1559 domain-containing protein [Urbifossiella sp.]
DDYEDDRPRRRRRPRDEDDYDDRPRRAKAGGMNVWIIAGAAAGVLLLCCTPIGIGLLLPAVVKVREAAARNKDTNNFKQIGIALHATHDRNDHFVQADGDLSWRVHILPYIEQNTVYQQFDLKQGWDAPQNRKLADTRILTYVSALDAPEFVQTRMRVFTGPDTLFPPGERPLRISEMTDGTSHTFLAVESTDAVPWSQPWELTYTRGGPLPALGHPNRSAGFLVVLVDGSVRFVPKSTNEATIRAGITPTANDGTPEF